MTESLPTNTPRVAELVAAERARLVFKQSRLSGMAKLPYAALIAWLLQDHLPRWVVLGWIGVVCAITFARFVLDYFHLRAVPAGARPWLERYRWVLACDGLVLGLVAFGDYRNPESSLAVMLSAAVVGSEAVAYSTLNVDFKAMLAHLLPALLPMTVWHLWLGTDAGLFLGLGALMFLALLVSSGWRVYRESGEMLTLRYQIGEVAAERAQALEAAQQSSEAKTQFLAMMSHEVRTPLHGILGLTRSMDAHLQAGDLQAGIGELQTLRVTGEHLITVINDALDLSALEQRRFRLSPGPFDLDGLLQDVARIGRAAAAEKGLSFELEGLTHRPTPVLGDVARLRQILLNLIGNAVKFTDRGFVRLALEMPADGGRARIAVIDSGAGIAAEHCEVIFEPYRRIPDAEGRHREGTGLGLTVARELARAMGGDLVCDSVPGTGSAFTLRLPLPAAPECPAQPAPLPTGAPAQRSAPPSAPTSALPSAEQSAPTPPAHAGSPHVLLVDDNRLNAYVAEFMLEQAGATFEAVEGGLAAVERARQGGFDLILMDCQMPDIDGFEATRRIREDERSAGRAPVPIVALTANAMDTDRNRSLAAGMNAHLSKPFSAAELAAVVHRMSSAGAES